MELAAEPTRLGRYVLERRLARGGMASVYLAHAPDATGVQRQYAIKIMHPHMIDDAHFRAMFLDEMRITSHIVHPNVCRVLDFGSDNEGTPYLVMEYLDGVSLAQLQQRSLDRKVEPHVLARIAADAARGLHAAHQATDETGRSLDVIHRDVSPHNLMVLRSGLAKVVDFGIARAHGRASMTRSGQVKGKVAYMSPEQLRGDPIDLRTDVFALGIVLWEGLAGYHPFAGQSVGEIVANVMSAKLRSPAEFVPDCSMRLATIVMKALRRELDQRTESAAHLANELESYLEETGQAWGPPEVAEYVSTRLTGPTLVLSDTTEPERRVPRMDPAAQALLRQTEADQDEESLSMLALSDKASEEDGGEPVLLDAITEPRVAARRTPQTAPALEVPKQGERPARKWGLVALAVACISALIAYAILGSPEESAAPPQMVELAAPVKQSPVREPAESTDAPERLTTDTPQAELEAIAEPELEVGDEPEPEASDLVEEAPAAPRRARASRIRPRARTPRPAAVEAPGFINAVCQPSAIVYLDGRRAGRTPRRVQASPGSHTLRYELADGRSQRVRVQVRSGEATRSVVSF